MCRSLIPILWALALSIPFPSGQAEELVSGPAADTPLGAIACYANSGPFTGKEFDAAAEVGEAPAAFLFVHQLSRNTAPVIRELNRLGEEHGVLGFRWFTIMLDNDRTKGESMLKRVNGSLKMANPLVLSLDMPEGPGDYALNRLSATLTLVLAKQGKVHRSIALTDTGPADFPKLRGWIEEVTGEVPEDESALRELIVKQLPTDPDALRTKVVDQQIAIRHLREQLAKAGEERGRGMQGKRNNRMVRRPDGTDAPEAEGDGGPPSEEKRKRKGKAPDDPALNGLLRSFIRKTNDNDQSDQVYADIEKRAGESDDLKKEAIEMFRLMLSFRDRYGTEHAQRLAENYLKTHVPAAKEE